MDFVKRKNIRLRGYDYSQSGGYFITVCTKGMKCVFGHIADGKMILSRQGECAQRNLKAIPQHMPCARIDKFAIMPNHLHMILTIVGTPYMASGYMAAQQERPPYMAAGYMAAQQERPPYMAALQAKSKQIVSRTIQQYKASVSRDTQIVGLWQSRFYDHIIRNDLEYQKIWQYIDENPMQWAQDRYFQ